MSEAVKRPRKSKEMYIKEALEMGPYTGLDDMTVPEIKRLIEVGRATDQGIEESVQDNVQEVVQEIENPVNCGHNDFRRVRVITPSGNQVYNQCKQCDYRELAE